MIIIWVWNHNYYYSFRVDIKVVSNRYTGFIFLHVYTHLFFRVMPLYIPILFQVDVIIFPAGRSTQSSNTAVLGLTSGQRVWVNCDEGHVFGAQGFRGTTFTGAFLYWKWLPLNCPLAPYLKTWRHVPFNEWKINHLEIIKLCYSMRTNRSCLYAINVLKPGKEILLSLFIIKTVTCSTLLHVLEI